MNTSTATIRLFQSVPTLMCSTQNVEKKSQMAARVLTQRTWGCASAHNATTKMTIPRIQVLVRDAIVCGQTNAEMNSQIPSTMLMYWGHGGGGHIARLTARHRSIRRGPGRHLTAHRRNLLGVLPSPDGHVVLDRSARVG
jgi:hypothetical protein